MLFADAVIVVAGPRYIEDDFQFGWLNPLSRVASGVQGKPCSLQHRYSSLLMTLHYLYSYCFYLLY